MSSPQLQDLRTSILDNKDFLLPEFEDTGIYQDEVKVHALGLSFRLLSHAQVEHYLEARSNEVTIAAWNAWKRNRIVTRPLVSMLGFSGLKLPIPPRDIPSPDAKKNQPHDIDTLLKSALKQHQIRIRENNGIRTKNVLSLFLPIGIELEDLDNNLLAELETFGQLRGDAAHRAAHVTTFADPKGEFLRIMRLLDLLDSFDTMITKLVNYINAESEQPSDTQRLEIPVQSDELVELNNAGASTG